VHVKITFVVLTARRGGLSTALRLIVARGAQWSSDSLRDYKVVGGTVIELQVGGHDEEDERHRLSMCGRFITMFSWSKR
jgi:hypothetical protein